MKANLIKVEQTKEQIIKKLNAFELDCLITSLIEYKEGNIQLRAIKRILNTKFFQDINQ